jgi:hypothetical protein
MCRLPVLKPLLLLLVELVFKLEDVVLGLDVLLVTVLLELPPHLQTMMTPHRCFNGRLCAGRRFATSLSWLMIC